MSYELIETVEVGAGGASSIEFTSIPQDGTDLVVLWSFRMDFSSDILLRIIFNSDTTNNYDWLRLYGTGSSVATQSVSGTSNGLAGSSTGNSSTASTFASGSIYISNYASSNPKSMSVDAVSENNGTAATQFLGTNLYSGGAITSLQLRDNSSNTIYEHSSASLYKVTA